MDIKKPKLSLDGQIEHLKEKGVLFNIMNEVEAKNHLAQQNNYFKLTAYRKNYDKHPAGNNKDKYINLEFAYLADIAAIDMQLRYRIVHMALDVEHHAKLQLLRKIDEYNEDGYQIIQDYLDSLSETQRNICDSEINRNKGNIYCGDIVNKYDGAYPVWAFIEIIPFGRLVAFYGFCAERFARTIAHQTNTAVTKNLVIIPKMSSNFRKNRMSNARIQQIITLFYMHKTMVHSNEIIKSESKELQKVMTRVYKNYNYYNTNRMIKGTFDFLKLVVDSWFKTE